MDQVEPLFNRGAPAGSDRRRWMHPRERRPSQFSRRDFLKRSAAGAFALTGASAFLAACGQASNPNATTPAPATSGPRRGPRLPSRPSRWPGRQPRSPGRSTTTTRRSPRTSRRSPTPPCASTTGRTTSTRTSPSSSARRCDCKVEITTFGGVDEALAKIRTGQCLRRLLPRPVAARQAGAVEADPAPQQGLPAQPVERVVEHPEPFYDVGSQYTVPYVIYTTGVAWRNDHVPDDIPCMANPYEIIWDPKYKGKIHVFDDYRESIGLAFDEARTDRRQHRGPGHAPVGQRRAGQARRRGERPARHHRLDRSARRMCRGSIKSWSGRHDLGPVLHAEGTVARRPPVLVSARRAVGSIGQDNMVVLKSAQNPVLAHMFINYLLDINNGSRQLLQPHRLSAPRCNAIDPTGWSPEAWFRRTSRHGVSARRTSTRATLLELVRAATSSGTARIKSSRRVWLSGPVKPRRLWRRRSDVKASKAGGVWYPRWFWPSFAAPGPGGCSSCSCSPST